MADPISFEELEFAIEQVLNADTTNFFELADMLGLDPLRDFAGANLSGTNINQGTLSKANFAGTNFSEANLNEANLSGANLSKANLKDVIFDANTIIDSEHLSEQNFASRTSVNEILNEDDHDKVTLSEISNSKGSSRRLRPAIKSIPKTRGIPVRRWSLISKSAYYPVRQEYLFATRPVLYQGYSHEALQQAIDDVQVILQSKGFLLKQSGKFDEDTKRAVEEFQRQHRLYVDGIVGPLTWAALCYPTLARQKTVDPQLQNEVRVLQEKLRQEGFSIQPNGIFEETTERAVKRFQRSYGLSPDGVCGPMTWAVLLGQRQKLPANPAGFYSLLKKALWLEQLLGLALIYLGIYFSPFENRTGSAPSLLEMLITSYALTFVVPFLSEPWLSKQRNQQDFLLFRFAPYVLVGFLWRPLFDALKMLLSY